MARNKQFQKIKTEVIYTEHEKRLDSVFEHSIGRTRQILTELTLLRELQNNDNIIHLHDVRIMLEFPQCDRLSNFESLELTFISSNYYLSDLLSSNQYFNNFNIKYILFQIAKTIQYIHSLQIIHRNLAPHNILIDRYSFIQLSDFGKAVRFNESFPFNNSSDLMRYTRRNHMSCDHWYRPPEQLLQSQLFAGTKIEESMQLSYMAPELLLSIDNLYKSHSEYTSPALDIWSIGAIFAELLQMKKDIQSDYRRRGPLFATNCDSFDTYASITAFIGNSNKAKLNVNALKKSKLKNIYKMCGAYDIEIDLLNKILVFDMHKRVNINALIGHSFFDDVRHCFDDLIADKKEYLNWNLNQFSKVKTCRELILEQVLYYNEEDRIRLLQEMPFMKSVAMIEAYCFCYVPHLFIIHGIKQIIHLYLYQKTIFSKYVKRKPRKPKRKLFKKKKAKTKATNVF